MPQQPNYQQPNPAQQGYQGQPQQGQVAPRTANAVAPQQQKPKPMDLLKSVLSAESIQQQFRNALGKSSSKFVASIIELVSSDTKLQQCSPNAIACECLKAAVLNLPINKALGYAYIVPFNNSYKDADGRWQKRMEPTFQLGYKGIIQLALRSGQFRTLNADVVYEGELRKVDKLTGEIAFDGEKTSDKIVGYFCYFELTNGFSKTLFMSVEDMVSHAKRFSKSLSNVTYDQLTNQANLPATLESKAVGWMGNFHAMAKKTVVRMLLGTWAPASIEMQNAITTDIESDAPSDGGSLSGGRETIDLSNTEYEVLEQPEPNAPTAQAAPTDAPY